MTNVSTISDRNLHGLRRATMMFLLCYGVMSPVLGLDVKTEREINHLLTFVHNSECTFFRNGSWHSSTEAAEHIKGKYGYVLKRGRIKSAEDFIALAASKSSISGKAYKVRCGEQELTSASWLGEELRLYRLTDTP